VPGALLFFVPLVTVSYAAMAGFDVWFSTKSPVVSCGPLGFCQQYSSAAPTALLFAHWYLWVLLITCFDLLVALGLSSLLGSRSLTIGILLPFQLIVAPLLSGVGQLGGVRQALFTQSFTRLVPPRVAGGPDVGAHMFGQLVTSSVGMAWFVLAAWLVVLIGAGAWRTATRDA
jgi:hypothetical protein